MQSFFIAAPSTGIGKTLVTAALAWQLRQAGKDVVALKPIISGYDPHDDGSDTAVLLKSCGIAPTKEAIDAISPWRYRLPLSPDMAAEKEGKPPVDLDELVRFCRTSLSLWERVAAEPPGEGGATGDALTPTPLPEGEGTYTFIETIGGIMSPVNHQHTVLDWMSALNWPVILVTGSYLGAISHTLMALEVLRNRNLPVQALVISESESGVLLADTAATLKKFLLAGIPVVTIPRIAASGDAWKHVLPISGICA